MTTNELIAKLYDNLTQLTPKGESRGAYISGYLKYALENIAEHGVESLESHCDYTSKRLQKHIEEQITEEMERRGV
jgi:hypothetical protein